MGGYMALLYVIGYLATRSYLRREFQERLIRRVFKFDSSLLEEQSSAIN